MTNPMTPTAVHLRWFSCDGMYMAIDINATSLLADLGVTADWYLDVPDLVDAVLLEEFEPLLQCMESWVDSEFDWQPVVAPRHNNDTADNVEITDAGRKPKPLHELRGWPQLTLSLTALQGTPRCIYLALPEDDLVQMPPLPVQWQTLVEMNVLAGSVRVCVDTLNLSASDHQKLGPDSLVLLKGSFDDFWHVTFDVGREGPQSVVNALAGQLLVGDQAVRIFPVLLNQESRELPDAPTRAESSVVDTDTDTDTDTRVPATSETKLDIGFDQEPDVAEDSTESGAPIMQAAQTVQYRVLLDNTFMFNRLYAQSIWDAEMRVVTRLEEPVLGSRVSLVSSCGTLPAYAGYIQVLGNGLAVLIDGSKG